MFLKGYLLNSLIKVTPLTSRNNHSATHQMFRAIFLMQRLSPKLNSLIGLQQQPEQNGILGAAHFLDMTRNEFLKNIKKH